MHARAEEMPLRTSINADSLLFFRRRARRPIFQSAGRHAADPRSADIDRELLVRSDLLRSRQQLLKIGTITNGIPNGVNL